MRRVVAAACGLLVGAAIVAPANGAVRVSPSALLKKQSAALYRANIPVLLPTSIRLVDTFRIPTTEGGRTRHGYALRLVGSRACHGGGACTFVTFTARSGKPAGGQRVKLRNGRVGYYQAMRCGASCSKPSIQWAEKGFTFSIVAALGTSPATQRTGLMAAANQAIVAGPRR